MSKGRSMEELRLQAERRLLQSKQKEEPIITPEGWQRLAQELEVHQIELEMQNDELQQAHSELERYLEKFTDLYDFAPAGYFNLDRRGVILNVNLTGARMLAMERSRIIEQHFGSFIHTGHRSAFSSFLEKVFLSQDQETTEIALQKQGNKELYALVEAVSSEDSRECRVALIDISIQKQAEKKMQESEQKYRILFETMSQGVLYQDKDGKIMSANPAAEQILGLSLDQMQGKTPKDLHWVTVHEDGSEFLHEVYPSMVALRMGEVVNNVVMGFYSPQSGRYIWLNITAVPQFMPGEDRPYQVIITFEDISRAKRLEVYNQLTPREKEVFKLMLKGNNRKVISEALQVSAKTADKHKENLTEKLKLYTHEDMLEFARLLTLV